MASKSFSYSCLSDWRRELDRTGIVRLTEIRSLDDALFVADSLGAVFRHPDADSQGLTKIIYDPAREAKNNGRAFSNRALFPHTDRSSVPDPPKYLLMAKVKGTASCGGEMTLVDGQELFLYLKQHHSVLLEKLKSPFCAVMPTDKGETAAFPVFSVNKAGDFKLRFRGDGDMFFDGLTIAELRTLSRIINDLTLVLPIGVGEAVLLNNHARLHGRTPVRGHRELWRLLIEEN
jgi:hypothetical protein